MGNLLTIEEMTQKLKIDRRTWQRWKKAQKIPYIVLPGNIIRFEEEKLELWLSKREVKARIAGMTI